MAITRSKEDGEGRLLGRFFQRQPVEGEDQPQGPKRLPRSKSLLIVGAVALIALAVLTSPRDDSLEAKLEQGVAAHNSGRVEEARQLYLEVLRTDPGNAVANFNLGVAAHREDRLEEAERYYQAALEKEPDFVSARFNYAILKEDQQDYGAAEAFYRQILEQHPDQVKARVNLGFLLVNRLNRREEGIEEFGRAVDTDPSVISRIPGELRPRR